MNITGMINDTTVWGTSSGKSKPQSTICRHIYTYKQEVRISAAPAARIFPIGNALGNYIRIAIVW